MFITDPETTNWTITINLEDQINKDKKLFFKDILQSYLNNEIFFYNERKSLENLTKVFAQENIFNKEDDFHEMIDINYNKSDITNMNKETEKIKPILKDIFLALSYHTATNRSREDFTKSKNYFNRLQEKSLVEKLRSFNKKTSKEDLFVKNLDIISQYLDNGSKFEKVESAIESVNSLSQELNLPYLDPSSISTSEIYESRAKKLVSLMEKIEKTEHKIYLSSGNAINIPNFKGKISPTTINYLDALEEEVENLFLLAGKRIPSELETRINKKLLKTYIRLANNDDLTEELRESYKIEIQALEKQISQTYKTYKTYKNHTNN